MQHRRNLPVEAFITEPCQRQPIDEHIARFRFDKAEQQLDQSGFTAARWSSDCNMLTGFHNQIDTLKHQWIAGAVTIEHIA